VKTKPGGAKVRKLSPTISKGNVERPTVRASAELAMDVYEPSIYDRSVDGFSLARVHLEETFTGGIEGTGVAELLEAARDGNATFSGIERVTGAVAGGRGSFLLRRTGTANRYGVTGGCGVVPGSGTRQLTGLRGSGRFRAKVGRGAAMYLDYWFE
jgi:Protein of unknown function (DUF3224)